MWDGPSPYGGLVAAAAAADDDDDVPDCGCDDSQFV